MHDGKEDPYRILGVERSSTRSEVKEAYRRLQFLYHPDKKTGDRQMYDRISIAYAEIQKNPAVKLIPVRDIERAYKGSKEEVGDIARLYRKYKGRLSKIVDDLLLSSDEDEERLRGIIDGLIADGTLRKHKNYNDAIANDDARKKRRGREAIMAESIAKEMGIDLDASLEDILNRREAKEAKFLEGLENKYLKSIEKK